MGCFTWHKYGASDIGTVTAWEQTAKIHNHRLSCFQFFTAGGMMRNSRVRTAGYNRGKAIGDSSIFAQAHIQFKCHLSLGHSSSNYLRHLIVDSASNTTSFSKQSYF